ncbi:epoxide hydrolase family protein [Bacillus sp. CGMCC 1.16607]|uniref:epoxide hydrolase family protein n=1 Tax=Bacillus sp. CGMCC 1.16607 TaxID=3351842 RepID=UPI003625D195
MNIKPFHLSIDPEEILKLKERLDYIRWPDEIPGSDWQYGIPVSFMKDIVDYWKNEFDWEKVQNKINSFSNFIVSIDDLDIHFIHERGNGANSIPIIIPHGYPGSFYEMLDIIPYLTNPEKYGGNPEDSFDVIIPSIPGHGFSDTPLQAAFEDRQVSNILVKLMGQLGYERFAAHGYDLGASILGLLCLDHPEKIIGYHTTSPGNPSPFVPENAILTEAEETYLKLCKEWYNEEGAYAHMLSTKPQTIGYSLVESPVGLAAFILEKWYLWTNPPSGNLYKHFTKDELLANVTIYWLTQTINSANRLYFEGKHTKWPSPEDISKVPIGVSLTATQPNERPPIEYVERMFPNIVSWEELGKGGHFVATEEPKLVAERIQAFLKKLR